MITYLAVNWDGDTRHISAYTYSEAYEIASMWARGNLKEFREV